MKINLVSGTGSGPTTVSAFDAALLNAGVTHWNLLHLSSVVPTGSSVVEEPITTPESEFGQRRYVVMAHRFAIIPGEQAWAGLGWCQDDSGKGLFVEITGSSEAQVDADLRLTLDSMKARRSFPLGPNCTRITGAFCRDEPVCALVIAVFPGTAWWH